MNSNAKIFKQSYSIEAGEIKLKSWYIAASPLQKNNRKTKTNNTTVMVIKRLFNQPYSLAIVAPLQLQCMSLLISLTI
ncbi:uncharacterized protein SPAPADRAFT_59023 [Spathaspora passalidarum NRRL Y-27907]|uniref:Uncharacterized protein n=1 Tax=Spathaspora passalidarum (strain NRRL Y-27907 / 11-Y1) TaxID=619300 RepID=G3AF42_SPAPN|nr:uncharacterized protein SPAPADRAFT_59023 [Spathaspora passalidarum NRRL Y-27907]EGW35818.1 hypothetical protein SPAPADRAFT_59023 [Spathaspora passalidarum NRRL Y-27907]